MKFNYDIFFKDYRINFGVFRNPKSPYNLRLIIDANERYTVSVNQLAYILATAYHETGHDYIPKYEFGSMQYFVKKYWLNSKVARWLGNDDALDAFKYRGRGLVQITGEDNYIKFGLADNPDKALEIATAIDILFRGMLNGMFSGKKLGSYVGTNNFNFIDARFVVNGRDRAQLIAEYAEKFRIILISSRLD